MNKKLFKKTRTILSLLRPKLLEFKKLGLRKHFLIPRYTKLRLHLFGISFLTVGIVIGSYLTLSKVVIPWVRALTEATHTMPSDTAFNASGYDDGSGATVVLSDEVRIATSAAWLDGTYLYKKTLTITNLASTDIGSSSPTTAQVTIDTKSLYDAGKLQADCDDLRVAFVATASSSVRQELPRSYHIASGATNCGDSEATIVTFPRQEIVGAGASDSNYEIYYGDSLASTPSFPREKYLNFDGTDDWVSSSQDTATALTNADENMTVEAWVYLTDNTRAAYWGYAGVFMASARTSNGGCDTSALLQVIYSNATTRKASFSLPHDYSASCNASTRLTGTTTLKKNQWYHLAGTFNATTKEMKLYVNGVEEASDTWGGTSDWIWTSGSSIRLGRSSAVAQNYFPGYIDEARYSNSLRYSGNFVPPTGAFKTDSNTVLLYHLDENSGQTISDASTNGYDATLGTDVNAGDDDPSWKQSNQAYAMSTNGSANVALVCPFNGSTTCVDGETPSTETGAIRYSGGKSALEFDGDNDKVVKSPTSLGSYSQITDTVNSFV